MRVRSVALRRPAPHSSPAPALSETEAAWRLWRPGSWASPGPAAAPRHPPRAGRLSPWKLGQQDHIACPSWANRLSTETERLPMWRWPSPSGFCSAVRASTPPCFPIPLPVNRRTAAPVGVPDGAPATGRCRLASPRTRRRPAVARKAAWPFPVRPRHPPAWSACMKITTCQRITSVKHGAGYASGPEQSGSTLRDGRSPARCFGRSRCLLGGRGARALPWDPDAPAQR